MQAQGRGAGGEMDDFNVLEGAVGTYACAEGFGDGFFGGEAGGKAGDGILAAVAVVNFTCSADAFGKGPVAIGA